MKQERHTEKIMKSNQLKRRLLLQAKKCMHFRLYARFSKFEENLRFYPKKPFSDEEGFRSLSQRFESVICGSDQVWNPNITGNDLHYFLDFCCDNTKRIAYAPSIGVETLQPDFADAAAKELKQFNALSVREVRGAELVGRLLNQKVRTVVDPTFLLPAEYWHALEKPCDCGQGEYILYYSLRHSPELWRFCKDLAEKKKLRIVVIGGNLLTYFLPRKENMQYAVDMDPGRWLHLMANASYVVTNSFHGTAFSITYRKNFYVGLTSLTNSRLENIVAMLGLENQVIRDGVCRNWNDTDYTITDSILPQLCEDSYNYLRNALEK